MALKIELGCGSHGWDEPGACTMEWISLIYQNGRDLLRRPSQTLDYKDDYPVCTNHVVARFTQMVNDGMNDRERSRIIPLIPKIMRCFSTKLDPKLNRLHDDFDIKLLIRIAAFFQMEYADFITNPNFPRYIEHLKAGFNSEDPFPWDTTQAGTVANLTQDLMNATSKLSLKCGVENNYDELIEFLEELLLMWEKEAADSGILGVEDGLPEELIAFTEELCAASS